VPDALSANGLAVGNPPTRDELTGLRGELIERALVLAAQYGNEINHTGRFSQLTLTDA
jgi:hypothetical protein